MDTPQPAGQPEPSGQKLTGWSVTGTETSLYQGAPSLMLKFGTFLMSALLLAAGIYLGVTQHPAFYALAGVGVVWSLMAILSTRMTYYEITTERLRITRGLLTRRTEEIELYRVKDATLVEPFPLRLFGLGDIEVMTVDTSAPRIQIAGVTGARNVREALRQSVERYRERKRVRMMEME